MDMERPIKTLREKKINPEYEGRRILPDIPKDGAFKDAPPWAIELYGELKLMELSIVSTDRKVEKIKRVVDRMSGKRGGIE
jgi:hypothetical protein